MAIIIAGAGSLGRVMCDFLVNCKQDVIGFVDEDPVKAETKINNLPVFLPEDISSKQKSCSTFIHAILAPKERKHLIKNLLKMGFQPESFKAPTAFISPFSTIGIGTTILDHTYIMNNAQIGDHVHVHFLSAIGHDVKLGDYCSCSPGVIIGGYAEIGEGTMLGMGVRVLPNIKIGEHAIVGANSVVTRDLPANCIAFGSPAKPINKDTK